MIKTKWVNLSLREKIFLTALLPVLIVLLIVAFTLIAMEIRDVRKEYLEELKFISKTIAVNASASIVFHDRESAKSLLTFLSHKRRVEHAVIFNKEGKIFVAYSSPLSKSNLPDLPSRDEFHKFSIRYLTFSEPVTLFEGEEPVGYIVLRSDLKDFYTRVITYAVMVLAVFFVALIPAHVVIRKLAGSITERIRGLIDMMSAISRERDYKKRIEVGGADEIGELADSFNQMLKIIETHQKQLEEYSTHLEKLVSKRTEELNIINKKLIEELHKKSMVEKALTESKKRYETIFETAGSALIVVEPTGKIVEVNAAFEMLTECERKKLIGRNITDFIIWEEELSPKGVVGQLEMDIKNEGLKNVEVKVNTISGEMKDCLVTAGNIPNDDKVIVSLTDITERKRLEEQLLQSQKLDAIGKLAGGVAHDFNNLLTIILGYCTILKTNRIDPATQKCLDSIAAAAEKGKELTQALLAFSRKQYSQPKPLRLNKVVDEIGDILKRVIGEDIILKIELSSEDPIIYADETQLNQVLMNLVTNAKDAMPHGGELKIVTDIMFMDDAFVKTHGYGKVGKYATIIVSDTGVGMDKEVLNRVFEPFFTTKPKGKGTGLGLSIVYGIVKQNNGYIRVQSEKGKGTEFCIYLPLLESEGIEDKKRSRESLAYGQGEIILLAEDEEGVRAFLKGALEQFGYRIIEARDGEEAVEEFYKNKNDIHLVLLDVMMPKKSGKEVCEAIKLVEPSLPVVLLSGYAEEYVNSKGKIPDNMKFLQKPVSIELLLKTIQSSLKKGERDEISGN